MEAVDAEFTKWLVTLGVGGVLAGFMFVFYRKDVRQYTELWKTSSEQFMKLVQDNTQVLTKLVTMLETQERNALRKEDIELIVEKRINK